MRADASHAGHLAPFLFTRRPLGELDIRIQIAYCGICHTDLHQIRNDWRNSTFPMVPGCAFDCMDKECNTANFEVKQGMHQCRIFKLGTLHVQNKSHSGPHEHLVIV